MESTSQVNWQLLSQPSPLMALPSSQSSPALIAKFPQFSVSQVEEQPSPLVVLPSSQASPRVESTSPSPHTSIPKQSARQPSLATRLPSSQASMLPLLSTPSPQTSSIHAAVQPSRLMVLPSSHS